MRGANWETEVPVGYTAVTGLLEPDTTVGRALARGEEIKGFCGQRGCARRCTIDLQRLVAKGFGAMQLSFIRDLWRCHSLTGCGFDLRGERSSGIVLRELVGRSHVKIRVKCAGCGFFRAYLVEQLLAQLGARQAVSHSLRVGEVRGQGLARPVRKRIDRSTCCGRTSTAPDISGRWRTSLLSSFAIA
jgi:hypothetical protein